MRLNLFVFTFKLFLLFLIFIQELIPIKIIGYADEVLLLVSILLIFIYSLEKFFKKNKAHISIVIFFLLILYSIVNYFVSPFSNSFFLMLFQVFISLKAFIISLSFIILYQNKSSYNKFIKITVFSFLIIFIITFSLNYLLGSSWYNYLDHSMKFRSGILRPISHLGGSANVGDYVIMSITTFLLIHKKRFIKEYTYRFFGFYSIIILILSLLVFTARKPILIIFPLMLFIKRYTHKLYYISFLIMFVVILAGYISLSKADIIQTTKQNLESFTTTQDNSYIRGLMFIHSINFFEEMFPFGTSPATFGSNLSSINTIEAYKDKDITKLKWLYDEQGNLQGIFDTGLGSLLAEYGFIGIVLIILFIIYFYRFFKYHFPNLSSIFLVIYSYLLIITLFAPAIMNDMTSCFFTINVLYMLTYNNN